MKNKKSLLLLVSCLSIFFISRLVHASEVYYLGASQGSSQGAVSNPGYSIQQRVSDLFSSLKSVEKNKDASGVFSGTLSQTVTYNDVGGNTSKSYLERGVDYITELNLNLQEKRKGDYNLEGQWFMRKTDDRRVDPRRDVRLKQADVRIMNPNNLYEFGDFYADLSPMVMGASLEGFNVDLNPKDNQHYHVVVARKNEADTAANLFQRNVFGVKADHYFFKNSELFSNFRVGLQAASSQDDSSTLSLPHTAKDLRNTVAGIDGEITFPRILSFQYEYARSAYVQDEDSLANKDNNYADALRLQPSLNFGKTNLRYLYYYAQPRFYSDAGSSMADKIQHQISLDHRFSDRASVTLTENYYWDHLPTSTQTKRTYNDEKYMTWSLVPWAQRASFFLRPYLNYQEKNSDDLANSAEAKTVTTGFDINDRLGEHMNWGTGYEYRTFIDEANHSSSEVSHRIKFMLGQDLMLWARRLYYSIEPNLDLRQRKGQDNKDVNISTGCNMQYDLFQRLVMRLGNTVADSNSATPSGDYFNNRGFWEFDFLADKQRSSHLVLRGERNNYTSENGTQSYKEQRLIIKYMVNF